MEDQNVETANGNAARNASKSIPHTSIPPDPLMQTAAAHSIKTDPQPKSAEEMNDTKKSVTEAQKETLDAIKKGERIALIIAAIVAFGTLGQWVTSWVNNSSTSDQTDKLISASQRSERAATKIADASKRNATAAANFATSAGNINTQIQDAVAKLNSQAVAIRDSARTAGDSLSAYRDAQSAVVVVENFNPDNSPNNPEVGKYQIVNRGNSIAPHVSHVVDQRSGKEWIGGKYGLTRERRDELDSAISKTEAACIKNPDNVGGYPLGVGEPHSEPAFSHPAENPAAISGEAHFIVVCYTDIFKRVKVWHDCIYWKNKTRRFTECNIQSSHQ